MTTSRTTLPKRKLYPLVTAGMLLMAVVLLLIAFDYTSMGLLLLGYGVGVHVLIRGALEWNEGIRTFYWWLLLGAIILLLMLFFYVIP
ncbi:hypothetical protein [Marinococcus halophilus]|uniref:hypothetical protein n=1 Tax=Marinococcus halophilus TaxID=1371 RepID=UPI0009A85F07|nr:hypothetical protein [Marinococcus halophilus]